ncbi:MAG: DUF488 domain-containing protein [Acidimicrobiaceae bacterium]|nr:DUF488 domain-containing protein [Acidimicrobiaceae bacterium]
MTHFEDNSTIASIGYERRTVQDLIGLLVDNGVTVLVDVRLTPISRKKGLSKTALAAALQAVGIEYAHERELGNPKDNRELFRQGSQDARNVYTAHMRNEASQAVQKVIERTRSQYVALFCYERQHSQCHRSCIADEIGLHCSGLRVVEL